jgi:hypothetical protein
MKLRTFAASGVMFMVLGSAAWADQSFTGTVTAIDRTSNEVVLKQVAGETTGANAAGAAQKFTMKGAIPETLHAEDKVTVSYTEANGVKTITAVNPAKQ